jgi:hypothetical protein
MGGQKVFSLLQQNEFQNIHLEHIPFSTKTIHMEDFALYLKQEVLCYSIMSGRAQNDPETSEIIRFIDEEVKAGKYEISYGMVLVSAELG